MDDGEVQGPEMWNDPRSRYGSSILFLTNPEQILENMEMTYRNGKYNDDNKLIMLGKPLMNEEGINSVMGLVRSIVNQVTIMSNLDKHEISLSIDYLGDVLAKDLMMNKVKYNINNKAARERIFFVALMSAFVCMKRAYQEGDRRFWKGSQQEVTYRTENNTKKGILGKLGDWGK